MEQENYTILYVDDEKANLEAFKSLYRRKFNIITVSSGKQGLEVLNSRPIDLIISDQQIPGMTGIEFLKKVKKSRPELKSILLTAFTDNDVIKKAINEVGIYWYANKPFDAEQMEQTMSKAIESYHAEIAVIESEKKFRNIFNSMSDVFTRSDMDGKCILISPSIYNIIGYIPEEIVGKNLEDFFASPIQRRKLVEQLTKSKTVETHEIDIVRKDGTIATVSTNTKLYYDELGNPKGVECVFRDVTGQKEAERKIKESESALNEAQDLSRIGSWSWEVEKNIVKWSDTMYDLVGWDKEKPPPNFEENRQVFDSESHEILGKAVERALSFHEPFELDLIMLHREGHQFNTIVRGKAVSDSTGKVFKLHGTVQDITKRKRSESEHNKLFNVSFDLLCISGFDGYFKELNPAWEQTMGYTLDELYAKPYREFIHPDDRDKTASVVKELSKEKKSAIGFENRYITKSGQVVQLSWSAIPVPEENLVYSIARDITDRKANEGKIEKYQQRLKGLTNELIITEEKIRKQIAVDLHDHVGQLLASMRMQMARITDMEEDPELIVRMKNISQGLLKCIQATRAAIFNLSPAQLNEIGLVAAVQDWMKEQIEQKHPIKTVILDESEEFIMDENTRLLLFRSLKELMMNTVKHAKASHLTATFKRIGNLLEMTIDDDGIGFNYSPDLLRMKSDSYGLFSIQERISDLGGSMEIDSVMDKGTLIKLTVPLGEKSL